MDRCPSWVGKSMCKWWRFWRSHVPVYVFVLVFNPRMGAESRWLSCSFGSGRTVSPEGRGPARGGDMVAWRSLDFMTRRTAIPHCLPVRTLYKARRADLRDGVGDFGLACRQQ